MKKLIFGLLVLSSYFLSLGNSIALADDEIRNLQVDLKAKVLNQSQYFDNLDSNTVIFPPGSQIQLQLTVRNLGNRNQTNVKVIGKLPSSVSINSPLVFTIPQISANTDYTQNFILTIKDKTQVNQTLTKNDMSVGIKSDIGTVASDNLYFYTNSGSINNKKPLPQTGSTNLIFGTLLSLSGTLVTLKARRLTRGY
ncbi:MAG: hypothetical protein WCV93_01805 [Candidatus Shapirobacteria bacterium]|jgi:uncharacterized repeat protein (TIGR01451 family)